MEEFTPPNQGKSIAEKVWDRLDRHVSVINEARKTGTSVVLPQVAAQECAEILVLMCHPYYENTEAVSREAAKRAKMAEGSIAWEPTPGYRYNPPPVGTPYPMTARSAAAPATKKAAPAIPAAKRGDILAALKMGLDAPSLASVYGVPLAAVEVLALELQQE